jgi:hypothetical protein
MLDDEQQFVVRRGKRLLRRQQLVQTEVAAKDMRPRKFVVAPSSNGRRGSVILTSWPSIMM